MFDDNDLSAKYDEQIKEISEKYSDKIGKAYLRSVEREYKNRIKEINLKNRVSKTYNGSLTASKFFMIFILVNCTIIELYSMIIMYILSDLTALSSLIAAVITESISYAIYSAKSYHGKKSEIDSELERDKFEFQKENGLIELGEDIGNSDDILAFGKKYFKKVVNTESEKGGE